MPHFGELLIATVRAMFRTVIGEEMPGIQPPEHQPDAVLNQANPVSGTKYTVLDTTSNVRIIGIAAECTWTVQPTPLEIHVTIDGQTIVFTVIDPDTATYYFAVLFENLGPTFQYLDGSSFLKYKEFLLEGRSVKIEAEITGGTVSNLSARVIYATW